MAKSSFLLVNLKEDQTKHLAQVITNDSCRKILDFLAENPATESELSLKLAIPISTVHYNIHALVKVGLVEADEFHYSSKGREVLHYKLANKYIIIAPKSTYGIKEKLRSILPAAGVIGGVAIAIGLLSRGLLRMGSIGSTSGVVQNQMLDDLSRHAATETAKSAAAAPTAVTQAVQQAAANSGQLLTTAGSAAGNITTTTISHAYSVTTSTFARMPLASNYSEPSIALWFFVGGLVAIAVYIMIDYIFYRALDK